MGSVVAAVALLAAPVSAGAAVEVGNRCEANIGANNLTVIQIAGSIGGLPVEMPFTGVVTSWTVNPGPVNEMEGTNVAQSLRIVRPTTTSGTTQYTTVGESETELPHTGPNTFFTRVPVQAGDHVGLFADVENQVSICESGVSDNLRGQFNGNAPRGTTQTYEAIPNQQPAVAVTLEPDIDGDGFGDETQDRCAGAPGATSGCPTVRVEPFATAAKRSATVAVLASSKATVTTTATVAIPELKIGKRQRPAKKVTLSADPVSTEGGKLEYFKLSFPKYLRAALAANPLRKAFSLHVAVTATDPLGRVTAGYDSVKLRGQRPVPKKPRR